MAPKGKSRKLKTVKIVEEKEEGDDDNNEVEEKADEAVEKDDEDFTMEEVLRWGGTKGDYIMLCGIDDSKELVGGGKKGAIDDLEEGELEKLINKLGLKAYASLQTIPDELAPNEDEISEVNNKEKKSDAKDAKTVDQEAKAGGKDDKKKTNKFKDAPSTSGSAKKVKQNANVFEFNPRTLLLVKPGGKWYDQEYTSETESVPQVDSLVAQYKALAQKLYEAEVGVYKNKKSMQKGANSAWMKAVVSTGTLVDRMAAMTVLIQDTPVHSLEHVESLVSFVKKKGSRRQGLMALDTLRELLISDLLPENRKLRSFSQRPYDQLEERASGNRDVRDRRLLLWYFEHQLKNMVAEFVIALDGVAHDTVLATKTRALTTAHELLLNRPEQERALLIQVVNKLGDPEFKVASKTSYLLETLLHKHPNMKGIVCLEVERLMFRPNINPKAQYYSACFLNQVILSHEESDLASKLISIYFSFFRACVKNKEVESKMLSALLTGVNRAYPYAKAGDEKIKEQLDTLFKVVHLVKFNTSVQALMLLFQVMDSQQAISDRYFVALYRKLLDPGLAQTSRQSMFLNLLYKSLKADIVLRRVKAFVKRLLQVSCDQKPTFACGALYLVSEVMKAKPGLKLLLDEGDDEEEKFEDLAEDDDEEEKFVDADKVADADTVADVKEDQLEAAPVVDKPAASLVDKPAASWVHHRNLEGGKNKEMYDPLHRNPLYCGADRTTLWELEKLSSHYHPSVALFAKTILQGQFIQYTGDPLQDFTLMRFLDRFVFRNPKQLKGKQNTDAIVMKPKQRQSMNNVRSLAVNCEEYLAKDEKQIPVDEIFFYRFFKKREQEKQRKKPRAEGDNESVEDVDDDEFERALDSYEGDNYFPDFKDTDLDFAGNVKKKSAKKKGEEASDSDLESDDDDGLDDEEVSLGSMDEEDFGDELEEEGGAFMNMGGDDEDDDDDDAVPELEEGDFDGLEDLDDGDDDDDDEPLEVAKPPKKGKRKSSEDLDFSETLDSGSKPAKKKKGKKDRAIFATAEEFGDLLDDNADFDNTGINAMANKDKASVKQLKWEAKRDDWMNDRDVKTLRKKKATFNKKKAFGKPWMGKRMGGKKKMGGKK
ncbi:CCAAT/enhancer-binding protein zeta [Clupea harengus]|uniref:CCAAT/enhancer-binding protein zeta n=1 Tax=Clupea harengus TaxID=7950 RepID=A0A8M1KK59_CLUHA|nr:CCAAT/enhancer-binding protein zeta [Clupea harengus]